ncbi:MAG: hypothetical protein WBF37_13170 [Dehalococcoidia bacterium]
MAKGLGLLFSQVRGSIGDLVFFPNQWESNVIREKVIPSDPASVDQIRWRTAFSSSIALWQSLSGSDRQGWSDYSRSLRRWRRGSRLAYAGHSGFMQSLPFAWYARSRGWLPSDPIGTPPVSPGYLSQAPCEEKLVASGLTGTRWYSLQPNPEDCLAIIWTSDEFSPTINRHKSPFNLPIRQERSQHGIIVLTKTGMTEGNVVFFRLVLISAQEPFRVSFRQFIRGVAIAVP